MRAPMRRARVYVVVDVHDDAGVDPDFDSWDGELTMAQWRDPPPPYWDRPADTGQTVQIYRPYISYEMWKHQLWRARHDRLDNIVQRFRKVMFNQLHDSRMRFKKAADKLDWQLWGNTYDFQVPGPQPERQWVRKS